MLHRERERESQDETRMQENARESENERVERRTGIRARGSERESEPSSPANLLSLHLYTSVYVYIISFSL